MRFAFLFPLIALGLCFIIRNNGGWTWVLVWPAMSFCLVGLAYALNSPRIFGKRLDGSLARGAVSLLLPYLALNWLLWHLVRAIHKIRTSEPCASQITDRVWIGRRLLRSEIPPGVICIVDMTCEFPAARGMSVGIPHYLALPTLDYGAPDVTALANLLDRLQKVEGGILFHCAQGHGRSAFVAAAFLTVTNAVADLPAALAIIKQRRPNVRLSRRQRISMANTVEQLTVRANRQSSCEVR